MADQNLIGDRVRKQRRTRGLTQDQLAAACQRLGWDVSRVSVAKIESGVRGVNDAEVIVLAGALKCPPGELLDKIQLKEAIKVVRQGKAETER